MASKKHAELFFDLVKTNGRKKQNTTIDAGYDTSKGTAYLELTFSHSPAKIGTIAADFIFATKKTGALIKLTFSDVSILRKFVLTMKKTISDTSGSPDARMFASMAFDSGLEDALKSAVKTGDGAFVITDTKGMAKLPITIDIGVIKQPTAKKTVTKKPSKRK